MQAPERFRQPGSVEGNPFPHLHWSGVVIEADDQNLFLTHGLLERAPVPAGKNRAPPEEIAQDHGKTHDSEKRYLSAPPTAGNARLKQGAVKEPCDR